MAGSRYPNIDASSTRRGEYIGYGAGTWRIVRWGSANSANAWRGTSISGPYKGAAPLYGRTLCDVSTKLANLAAAQAVLP